MEVMEGEKPAARSVQNICCSCWDEVTRSHKHKHKHVVINQVESVVLMAAGRERHLNGLLLPVGLFLQIVVQFSEAFQAQRSSSDL